MVVPDKIDERDPAAFFRVCIRRQWRLNSSDNICLVRLDLCNARLNIIFRPPRQDMILSNELRGIINESSAFVCRIVKIIRACAFMEATGQETAICQCMRFYFHV